MEAVVMDGADVMERQKRLMRIIIGSAWVDRQLTTAEVEYFQGLLQRYRLTQDKELLRLLETAVPMQQTEQWMREYLRDTTDIDRQKALAAIAKMLIADDTVSDAEHQLLDDFYDLMAQVPARSEDMPNLVETLGKFVQQAAQAIDQFVNDMEKKP